MKIWKKKGFIFVLLCMFSYGCGQNAEPIEKPVEEVVEEISDVLSIGITPLPEPTLMEEQGSDETDEEIEKSEMGFPVNDDIVINVEDCNAINRKLTRTIDSGASLFCLDKEENIYFVNQRRDNYLYCRKDGVTELVVALPVKDVYPWEDCVYFMVSEAVEGKNVGDIYRYIPATKEIELVYELGSIEGAQHHKMLVNEQGIHFNYAKMMSSENGITRMKVSSYTLPFGETEPIKDTTKAGKVGWNDYYFSYQLSSTDDTSPVEAMLVSRSKGMEETISLDIGELQYAVAQDTIYSIELGSKKVSLFSLEHQKKNDYDFKESIFIANNYLEDEKRKAFGENIEELTSFTITENGAILWATDGEYLYRMNMEDNTIEILLVSDGGRKIEALYTDGRQVYGVYSYRVLGFEAIPKMVRFCTEYIEKNEHGQRVIQVEALIP